MSSPTLNEFSDMVAPSIDGRDDLPTLHTEPADNNPEPPIEMLPAVDSFVSIIERLPGLVLEDNAYHIDGPLMEEELEQLTSYTRRIKELVLTDTAPITPPDIAPETLARLALIQDPKSPFLSSLECLRIIDANQSLLYLFFCLVPSLNSLEIVRAPSTRARQIALSSFLKELVIRVPRLSNITLCGRVSKSFLQSSLKFNHLRQLHLTDAVESLDFAFLKEVSMLPDLESFLIDAHTAQYKFKRHLLAANNTSLSPTTNDIGSPNLSLSAGQMAIATDLTPLPFPRLRKLAVTGNIMLMEDLISHLPPRTVKEVSLTLVRPLPESPTTAASGLIIPPDNISSDTEHPYEDEAKPEDPMYTMSIEELKWMLDHPTSKNKPGRTSSTTFETMTGVQICLTLEAVKRYKRHLAQCLIRVKRETTLIPVSQTSIFAAVIEMILDFGALESFSIDVSSHSAFTEVHELPWTTLGTLLSYPSLKELKIAHWALPFMEESIIDSTTAHVASPMSLQRLQLPVDETSNTGITISTLDLITHYYPRLIYLECFIDIPAAVAMQFDEEVDITPHGLEVLSVGGAVPHKIPVATHLSLLFPHLKAINTHEGYDEEDWQQIHSLVKMCHTMTLAAEKRLHRVAHQSPIE
ncbi:hypothetical protein BJ912DRAFT_637759 [Pholiota molesta]|nr:hypothetical protein BJ912DRAFT_637759 [Pholiota molesta]